MNLNDDEAAALVAIAQDGVLARGIFAWRSFSDPNHARKALGKAAAMARAVTRLDARAGGYFREWVVVPGILSPEPTIRAYAAANSGSIQPSSSLVAAVLAALAAAKGDPFATGALARAYAAAAQKLSANDRGEAASKLLAAGGWCLATSVGCFDSVAEVLQALDADLPLHARTARVVEIMKFPQSAVLDPSPLARLAESPPAAAGGMPAELWAFLAWVAEKYPDIDLTSGPSVERLAAVGRS